ncbi:hypothetical protein COS53_01055, partial [Candidatus Shapirobacteria bacterium CG03_land_8_20_14_0_80_35_14]
LTLDEKTGKFIPQKIEGLMDMGKQMVYRLVTQSGKTIETTNNHPYLVLNNPPQKLSLSTTFTVDQSNRLEDLNHDSIISLVSQNQSFIAKIDKNQKQILRQEANRLSKPQQFWPEILATTIIGLIQSQNINVIDLTIDQEYVGHDRFLIEKIKTSIPLINIHIKNIGHHSLAHHSAYYFSTNKKSSISGLDKKQKEIVANSILKGFLASELLHQEWLPGSASPHYLLSNNNSSTSWTKVKFLHKGMIIATADGWEKINTLYPVSKKQTYDIQVAHTHNFIGNNIVAHNTYLSGNVGIGTTNPSYKLSVGSNDLSVDSVNHVVAINALAPLSSYQLRMFGKLRFEGNGIIDMSGGGSWGGSGTLTLNPSSGNVILNPTSGNVGIGTTSPTQKLDVNGSVNIGGSLSIGSTYLVTNLNADYLDGLHSSSFIQNITAGVGINLSGTSIGKTIAVDFNSTNLKITANQINTIQDITTTSSPTFAKLGLGSTHALYLLNVGGTANFNNLYTSGWVGIGTTAPTAPLYVGTTATDQLSGYFTGYVVAQKFIDLDNYANYFLD